ncbi:hypothetical protein BGZ75_008480 [Mortierella antarctica]|nr:hypothetical protein BGZ75_008480 [Mortierella antarctica]
MKVTNPQNIEILRTRLSARDDEPVFDQPFGVLKNDQDAAKFGDRLSGIGLYQYPVSLASEAILAHPSCQLTEVSFGKEMQGIWIDVITSKSPKESTLPNVNNELGYAIVLGADLKVGKGVVERMPADKVGFWKRSYAHAVEQIQHGRGTKMSVDFFISL